MSSNKNAEVSVRHLHESELPQLLALLKAKAEFDGAADSLVATVETLRHALFADQPKAQALVAVKNGELIGMATYYAIFSSFIAKPCIWLDDLYIYEPHRAKGIGRALVKRLCEIAHEHGCGRIDWLVATLNEEGQGFYAHLGATVHETVRLARLDERAIREFVSEGE